MNKRRIIKKTEEFVRDKLKGEGSGHDFWHVYRVWKNAIQIARREKADLFVVELAALLHDVADWKFCGGDDNEGPRQARAWLSSLDVEDSITDHVCSIIKNISFKGAGVGSKIETLEGKVVQDADRLDAIGAIGIGRTFAYGGHKGREMHDPSQKPKIHKTFEQYKNSNSTSVNHFYEKLLLLKDLMNTETAKEIAETRNQFMEKFLKEFFKEWEGKD